MSPVTRSLDMVIFRMPQKVFEVKFLDVVPMQYTATIQAPATCCSMFYPVNLSAA